MHKKQKKAFTQADRASEAKHCCKLIAKIDIDALKFKKNEEQMRLKIGKKLKTASLKSKVTGSEKKNSVYTSTCSVLKNFETIVAVDIKVY